jgi:hypothetical protein
MDAYVQRRPELVRAASEAVRTVYVMLLYLRPLYIQFENEGFLLPRANEPRIFHVPQPPAPLPWPALDRRKGIR